MAILTSFQSRNARPRMGHLYITNFNGNSVTRISLASGIIDAPLAVANGPFGIRRVGGNLYVANQLAQKITRIDIATFSVTGTLAVGHNIQRLAWDGRQHLYVPNNEIINPQCLTIDLASFSVDGAISVGSAPAGVCWDGGHHMYVVNSNNDTVSEIDINTGLVDSTVAVGHIPIDLVWDGVGHVWTANASHGDTTRIDTSTGLVDATFFGGANNRSCCVELGGYIYFPANGDAAVSRLTLAGVPAAPIAVGNTPIGICSDLSGHIFVTNQADNTVSRINTATATVEATYPVGASPRGICWDGY